MLSGSRTLAQEDVTVTGQLTFRAKSLAQKEHSAHEQDRYWNEKQNDHVSPLGTVTGEEAFVSDASKTSAAPLAILCSNSEVNNFGWCIPPCGQIGV
jgi:hypothetical protein